MIDLHCHVLPATDDGPSTMDGTLALGRAAAAGIDTLVATPHVSARYPTSAGVMQRGVDGVNRAFTDAGVPVTVRPGGEIDVMSAAQLDDDELRALRLGGGDWLLLECPLARAAAAPFELVLSALQARGHRLVLAQPERSALIRRRPALLSDLVDAGMLSSITAGSLVGRFGDDIQRFALEMLEAGLVHNVTSDAHDANRRPPGLRDEVAFAARELPGVEEQLAWLTGDVPRAILGGGDVPPRPGPPLRRRHRWWRKALRR